MAYVKLIDNGNALVISDYRDSGGVSNFTAQMGGHVGARWVVLEIKIDPESTIYHQATQYINKDIKAIVGINTRLYVDSIVLTVKAKDPFTIGGKAWIKT